MEKKFFESLTIIQKTNWVLAIACALALTGTAVTLLFTSVNAIPHQAPSAAGVAELGAQPMDSITLSELVGKNLFKPLIPAPVMVQAPRPVVPVEPPAPKIPIAQKAAHLKLVGIIGGDAPQAILEDQRRQTTIYAAKGQMLDELQVENVYKDHVTLISDGDRLDLAL